MIENALLINLDLRKNFIAQLFTNGHSGIEKVIFVQKFMQGLLPTQEENFWKKVGYSALF